MSADSHRRERIRILGPLEVRSRDGWRPVPQPEWRSVLAILLANAGQAVSLDTLIDAVWGSGEVPEMAANLVSLYVHRLRHILGDPDGQVIAYCPPGYVLQLGRGTTDAHRFEVLAAAGENLLAAGEASHASRLLGDALKLWRGDPLSDVRPSEPVVAEALRLEELRLAATELQITADLACQVDIEPAALMHRRQQILGTEGHDVAVTSSTVKRCRIQAPRGLGAQPPDMAISTSTSSRDASSMAGPCNVSGRADFGREFTALRIQAGLTTQQIAEATGIAAAETEGYFSGRALPVSGDAGLAALRCILAVCGITDPRQVFSWVDALVRAWACPADYPPSNLGDQHAEATGRDTPIRIPVPDAPGYDLRPDPLQAQTAVDLVHALRQFRLWAGKPSFRKMAEVLPYGSKVSIAAMCMALRSETLPSEQVMTAIVVGCGGTREQLQEFMTAWRQIQMIQESGTAAAKSRPTLVSVA